MNSTKYIFAVSLLILAFGSAQHLLAQGTDLGTIRGVVTDASGAVIPNAKITVTDASTGSQRVTETNAQGEYQVFGLPSGPYKVTVVALGMSTAQLTGIVLRGSDSVSANATLKVAAQEQAIEVTSEVPLVNTDDQTISDTLTSTAVLDLPRDSRDIYDFLYLNPNITQGSADGEFKFLGAQSYGANFSVDGQRANGGIFGDHTASQPSLEAIGDVNVLSSDFSAEYSGIANIRVTTKRGSNGYHGSLFYNNKNSALAAWTLQDQVGKGEFVPNAVQSSYPNPYFNITDIGASLGGPVPLLKKTWFFAAYERDWSRTATIFSSTTLPHPSLWTGDFSLMDDDSKPAVPSNIVLTPDEIANDTVGGAGQQFIRIPSRLLNPSTQAIIQNYFPKIGLGIPINPANGRIPLFVSNVPANSVQDLGTLRLDHDFSDRDHAYMVYNASAQGSATNLVQSPYSGLGLTQSTRRDDTVSLSYTHTFSNSVINELRGGFNRERLRLNSNTTLESFLSSIGFTDDEISAWGDVTGAGELGTHGHAAVNFGGRFATFNNGGRNTDRPEDQRLATFGDTLTWVKGKHNFKFGGDWVRNAAIDGFALNRGNPRGLVTYSGSNANPFTQFLLGEPGTSVTYVNIPRPPMNVYNWEQGFFGQDDWKVNSRLTLNLGLRYELITPFVDQNDLIANFDTNYVDPTTGQKGRFIIPSDRTLKYLDTRVQNIGYVTAAQSGLDIGRGLVRTDKNNLAPRLGFALRLTDKTALRGGWGLYYPTSAAQGIRDPIATNAFNQGITKRPTGAPLEGWPGFEGSIGPLTGGTPASGFGGLPAINAVPVNLQSPRMQQYNVTVERELDSSSSIRLSYLGSTVKGLIAGVDLNEIAPSDQPFGTTIGDGVTPCDPVNNGDCDYSAEDIAREPFPGLGDFLLTYGNYGHSRTNAFQAEYQHRYTHGFMLDLAYTYQHQYSTGIDTGNSSLGGVAYDIFNPNADYTQEGYVPTNRFVAYGVYELPIGRGRRFGSSFSRAMDTVLGGWQTTFNMFAKTGTGFTPFWICDNCDPAVPGNIGTGSIDAVGDFGAEPSFRPLVVGDPNKRSGNQIWDPNAFALPPLGADLFSNAAIAKRNMLMGPGTWGVNLGIHKIFAITERVNAELGADFDNVFNHPLFSPDQDNGGGGGSFALLGDFDIGVNPDKTLFINDVSPNDQFGRLTQTYKQEGIDNRRTVRLKLRVTF